MDLSFTPARTRKIAPGAEHSDDDDDPTIFDLTPKERPFELSEYLHGIVRRGFPYHPMLSEDEAGWKLPALNDKEGILDILGFSPEGARTMLKAYNNQYNNDPQSLNVWRHPGTSYARWTFPILNRFVSMYTGRDRRPMFDYEYTFESYVAKCMQQGLKLEFAVQCGLHPDAPDYADDEEDNGKDIPANFADDFILRNGYRLEAAWVSQLQLSQPRRTP